MFHASLDEVLQAVAIHLAHCDGDSCLVTCAQDFRGTLDCEEK